MGFTINAKCKNCFFWIKDIFVSYGQSGPNPNRVPAFDLKTNKLVVENYYNKEQLKGVVIFYNQPEMYTQNEIPLPVVARVRNKLERLFAMLFDRRAEKRRKKHKDTLEVGFQYECKDGKLKHGELVKLSRYNNKCPKCKKYAMMFEEGEILWD